MAKKKIAKKSVSKASERKDRVKVKKTISKAAATPTPSLWVTIAGTKILPLGERVLVRQQENELEKTASGIFIPDSAKKEKPEKGSVIAVGEGRRDKDGKLVPLSIKVGDTVVFSKYGFDEVKIGADEYLLIKEEHILAIINEK